MNHLLEVVNVDVEIAHQKFENAPGWDPAYWGEYDYLLQLAGIIQLNNLTTSAELKFYLMTEIVHFSSDPIPNYLDNLERKIQDAVKSHSPNSKHL